MDPLGNHFFFVFIVFKPKQQNFHSCVASLYMIHYPFPSAGWSPQNRNPQIQITDSDKENQNCKTRGHRVGLKKV